MTKYLYKVSKPGSLSSTYVAASHQTEAAEAIAEDGTDFAMLSVEYVGPVVIV